MCPSEAVSLSIFAYSDYRLFLRDIYEEWRSKNRNFSHRFISAKVGASSSGWFSDVIKSRMNLTGNHLLKLAALLMLKDNETDYFEALVQYNQAGSIEEKNRHFKKLMSFKEMQVDVVGQEKFEYYSNWYYSAVRELLFFYDFKGDYAALAKRLVPPIKTTQAKEAIRLLDLLGFIRKDAQGIYRSQTATLKKDSSFKSLYAINYMKATIELGLEAMERFPKEDRHVSTMTLSFSRSAFEKAQHEIEALRKKLVGLMQDDPHPDRAFQLNLQFFPITQ